MDITVAKVFQESARIFHDRTALKIKEGDAYHGTTYGEAFERVRQIGTGLQALGVEAGEKVGLISDNRPEWILCDLACLCIGAADVPRGSDSTPQEIDYILSHADTVASFVEDGVQLDKVLTLRSHLPNLQFLVVMDPAWDGPSSEGVYRLDQVAEKGRALIAEGSQRFTHALDNVRVSDLATIIYTSGTTGEPKGVMLTHRNLVHNIETLPGWIGINERDRFLSILPPWHIFERIVEYVALATGASLAYTSIRTFAADMALEEPTLIPSVPRIWEGVYFKVMAGISREPETRQKIFHALVGVSKKYVKALKVMKNLDARYQRGTPLSRALTWVRSLFTVIFLFPLFTFAQKKFSPIRARTGGKLRAAISGGGALPAYVDEFFAAVGITLLEGYGLTETSPVLAARSFERQVLGTVGRPITDTEIKIVDESGETLPAGDKGIIKCRGAQVMEGYYKKPEETARVIDGDGWMDTGDLGRLTLGGELSITGRAKETIVLLGGENVEPTPIEDAVTESPFISQVMIVGQDRKSLGALVVPDFDSLRERSGLEGLEAARLCCHDAVVALIRDEIRRLVCVERGFKHYEKVTRCHVLDREFSLGEELTYTMKKRRNVIAERYADTIDELYR